MKRLNIYTRFNLSIMAFVAAGLFGMALMVSSPVSATTTCAMVRCGSGTTCVETPSGAVCQMNTPAPAITCANVRCAGTCTDTTAGPVCGPRPDPTPTLSCANVLCQSGICVETRSGPQCVSDGVLPPKSHPPKWYPNKKWKKRRHKHKGRVCYESHWQPWGANHNGSDHTGHGHDGHNNNGHHHNGEAHPHPHPHPYPPKPLPPKPMPTKPTPGDSGMMCPMVYQPVCAEKIVQCVKAPCPPLRKTFGNSCEAQRDGYTVMRKGQCHGGYPQEPIK